MKQAPTHRPKDAARTVEAIELSAETAREIARGLAEMAQTYPRIACPRILVVMWVPEGVLVLTETARWLIRRPVSHEHQTFLWSLIRSEFGAEIAGTC